MSIEGARPRGVSHVSPRTHTPVDAHVIFLILGGFLYAYIYNLVPGYTTYTLAVTAVATVMYIGTAVGGAVFTRTRSEEHTSELQSLRHLVCRLLLEKKKNVNNNVGDT